MKSLALVVCAILLVLCLGKDGALFGYQTLNQQAIPSSSVNLSDVLHELSVRGHACFLGEGTPLHNQITGKDAEKLLAVLHNTSLSYDEVVNRVALAYDYRVGAKSGNTYVFLKQYQNSEDLPRVTFNEVRRSLNNIVTATQSYQPADRGKLLHDLLFSFREEKRVSTKGVLFSDLNPQQQEITFHLLCSLPFNSLRNIGQVSGRIQACRSKSAYFSVQDFHGTQYPIYRGPFGYNGQMIMVVLGGWIYTQSGGGTIFEGVPGKVEIVNQKIVDKVGDPTTPTPILKSPTDTFPATTLRNLAVLLTAKMKKENNDDGYRSVMVDSDIARNTVFVVGEQHTTARNLLDLTVDMYGYRVIKRENNEAFVTLLSPRVVNSPTEVAKEVSRLLPKSFMRAVQGGTRREFDQIKTPKPEDALEANDKDYQEYLQKVRGSQALANSGKSLYNVSVRNLRAIIEPLVLQKEDKRFPIVDAPEEARDLLALSSLATCTKNISEVTAKLPSYVLYPENSKISLTYSPVGGTTKRFGTVEYSIVCNPSKGTVSSVNGTVSGVVEP